MPVTRWAISLEKALAKEIKRSAAGEPISAWLADAARRKLRRDDLRDVIADWEKQHGEITEDDLAAAGKRYETALRASQLRRGRRR